MKRVYEIYSPGGETRLGIKVRAVSAGMAMLEGVRVLNAIGQYAPSGVDARELVDDPTG